MSTYTFPRNVPVFATRVSQAANTAIFRSPLTGALQSVDRSGETLRVELDFQNLTNAQAAQLEAFISNLNGQEHRVALHVPGYTQRGTIAAPELAPALATANMQFPSGYIALTDTAAGVRIERRGSTSNGFIRSAVDYVCTVGKSYALKIALSIFTAYPSRGNQRVRTDVSETIIETTSGFDATGVAVLGYTAPVVGIQAGQMTAGTVANHSYDLDLTLYSMARALLVDNGTNELTKSEEFEHADWTKTRSTISADAAAAPDGQTTMDKLIEDATAASTHLVEQSITRASVAEFWTGNIYFAAAEQQRIQLRVSSNTGGTNGGQATFDAISGSITLAAANNGTGLMAFATIHDYGGGIYRARLSVFLEASTVVEFHVRLCDGASNTASYDGDGSSGLYIWGAQLQRGGQIGRYAPTTTAAAGATQTGQELWLKGFDDDTNGQLVAGDQLEIAGQLVIIQSDVNADPAGAAVVRVRPRIRTALADETPAIINKPQGRFILENPINSRSMVPGRDGPFSAFSLAFIEDIT